MKSIVMASAATILAAGVASAFALAPSSQSMRAGAQLASAEPNPLPAAVPAPTGGKPTLEARHAPVPLLLRPRVPIEMPKPADVAGAEEPKPQADTPKTGDDPAGGAAAKAAVEADGYKGVKVLRKGDNGLWYAEGLRGSTKVLLMVDAQGNVTSP
jgi:hypothetical protein